MNIINAQIGRDHYRTILQTENNTIVADEPLADGGTDMGFAPAELLASSLGACTCITLRMYADRKGFPVETVTVSVSVDRDIPNNITNFRRTIAFTGAITAEQRQRLLHIANQCPVHKALTNPIAIETVLVPDMI
jgi:putative redox protein